MSQTDGIGSTASAPMNLAWLIAAPIAHRGLHDRASGVVENTATAADRAVASKFTIECDVQRTADGEAVVFHDFALDRLTTVSGAVADRTAADLGRIPLRDTDDKILTLQAFLARIAGRVPVIVEVKSAFDGDMRLADRVASLAADAPGQIAFKSFDPDVIAHLRGHSALAGRATPRGIVAEAVYDDGEWAHFSPERRRELSQFLHFDRSQPDFVSYRARDLPCAAPYLCRAALRLPVMAWTIRNPEQARHGLRWADQIIFEDFDPR